MAAFLINSAGLSVAGTPGNDTFVVESGAQAPTLQGLAGNDEFLLFRGANNSAFNFGGASIGGNVGDDIILNVFNTGVDYVGNFFGGGQGNDQLLFTAGSAGSASFIGNALEGGQGNDTLKFLASGLAVDGLTMNGNAGADYVSFSARGSGAMQNLFIAGGADNDAVIVDIANTASRNISVNGGLGEDVIRVEFANTATNLNVNGGTFGTTDAADGADNIFVSAENISGGTIGGNGGFDTIFVDVDSASNLLIAGNNGADELTISSDFLADVTVGGGKGFDLITVNGSGGTFTAGNSSLIGGNADDTIVFTQSGFDTGAQVTIQGGAGADLFFMASAADATAGTAYNVSGGNFSYASLSDSTIDTLDTIVVGTGGGSGIFQMFMPQAVDAFNGVAGGFAFTSGILEFNTGAASGATLSLSQIVGTLDATLSVGDAVGFRLSQTGANTGDSGFVFVKGASDDLLVEFAELGTTAFSAGNATLRNNGNNALDLSIG